jgi:putative ABC transport system permease protein
LNQIQLWVPRPAEVPFLIPSQVNNGGYFFQVIARLRPGISLTQVREAMKVVTGSYRQTNPANVDAPSEIEVVPLLDDAVGDQRQSYLLLFAAVGCVLLIACANIANLQLARFAGRRREIAARFALGASRADVVRQLVVESLMLAVLGGAVGLLFANWAIDAVVAYGANLIPRVLEIAIDRFALGFSLVISTITGLMIGVLPAWRAARVNVNEALKDSGRGSIGSRDRLRAVLLVGEVSLSLVLLIAAGLLLTSFARLQQVKPGFDPEGVFTAQLALPRQYDRDKLVTFYEQLYRRLATLPGITVGRAHRSRPAHRRPDTGAGRGAGPRAAAAQRTCAGEPSSHIADLLQNPRHSAPRGTRFRRARQRPRAARRNN